MIDELNKGVDERNRAISNIDEQELRYGKRSCYDCLNRLRDFETKSPYSQIPIDEKALEEIKKMQKIYKLYQNK